MGLRLERIDWNGPGILQFRTGFGDSIARSRHDLHDEQGKEQRGWTGLAFAESEKMEK